MERPTIDLILPDSKANITIYKYLSNGQYKELQRMLVSNMKLNLPDVSGSEEDTAKALKESIKDIPVGVAFDQEEILQKFLVKEIKLEDGTQVTDVKDYVYNLTIADGKLLQAELNKVEQSSNLSETSKKK